MNKFLPLLAAAMLCLSANAQKATYSGPATQPFGTIDNADLDMKACDFEKDANAEVLFDKANVYFGTDLLTITTEMHRRIKIFNDNGKKEADIHIKFFSGDRLEYITGLQAQTINLVNGKPEITKLDKKLIYTKNIDKYWSEVTFSFPNVKPGSVIEYKYNLGANSPTDFPDWFFQDKIPVRYSELKTSIPEIFYFRANTNIWQPLVKQERTTDSRSLMEGGQAYPYTLTNELRAMANVPSLPDEPYMSSFKDNVQSITFQLVSFQPLGGFVTNLSDTWGKVGGRLIDNEDFGGQLKRKITGEETIISKAKQITSIDQRIAYVFNEVKNAMKWNGHDDWHTEDGTYRAWERKTGNSTEINLILYHLLKQSGIDAALPMVVSTRDHGRVKPFYTSTAQFNRGVVYVPIDSARQYILDATGKYNLYNVTPAELLNSSGLWVDKAKDKYDIVLLRKDEPVRESVFVSAEIKAGGKVDGNVQISSASYGKIDAIDRYKTDGEKKYTDYLRRDDNNIKITGLKLENMEVDTLPLMQKFDFTLDLPGSDDNYIYLNPNMFSALKKNEFLNENRMTNLDFGYGRSYSINGVYKIPAGYKADALPKSVTMSMPDKSFTFRRVVAEQNGTVVVRYNVSYNVPEYSKDNYPDFFAFFKKMHELLNEQIVLKKG
ncbi:MAG: DUF3857 domain-containing protein [Mucilaginibacter sp.]